MVAINTGERVITVTGMVDVKDGWIATDLLYSYNWDCRTEHTCRARESNPSSTVIRTTVAWNQDVANL